MRRPFMIQVISDYLMHCQTSTQVTKRKQQLQPHPYFCNNHAPKMVVFIKTDLSFKRHKKGNERQAKNKQHVYFLAAAFLGAAFLAFSPILKDALICLNWPLSAPFFKAARRLCWAHLRAGYSATIQALMAVAEEPVRSFKACHTKQ